METNLIDPPRKLRVWPLGNGDVVTISLPKQLSPKSFGRLRRYIDVLELEEKIQWDDCPTPTHGSETVTLTNEEREYLAGVLQHEQFSPKNKFVARLARKLQEPEAAEPPSPKDKP